MDRYSPEDIAARLGKTRLLAGLPPTDLLDLARAGRQERVASGGAVFLKGAPGQALYLLCEGRVKITSSGPNGNELLLEIVDAGEHFGEISILDGGARTVNAIATRPSQIVSFDRSMILPVLHSNPETALALSLFLCDRLRVTIDSVEKIGLLDAPTRLWMRLQSLGERYAAPEDGNGSLEINHGLSQQNLADSIGVTRVMVNRQLGIWREKGLIEDGRGFIRIPNPQALEAFVRNRGPRQPEKAQ